MQTTPKYDPTNFGNPPGDGPLRVGGQNSSGAPSDENLPSTRCIAAKRQVRALRLVRDLWAGNERVQDAGETYLPRAPRERGDDYAVRLQRATLYNTFRNTIQGLTGFVFRVPPKLGDDVPAQVVADWENIDLAGTHGDVFARDRMCDAMTAGHAAILVDYPDTPGGAETYADDLKYRPYWVPLTKEQLLSWRTTIEDGRSILAQLVVEEKVSVPYGMFGDKIRVRYRVFYRTTPAVGAAPVVGWKLLEITEQKSVILVGEGLYPTQKEIPVAEIVTNGKVALFDSDPPFLDLAYLNFAHYRQWSDADTSQHMTCVPILFTAGVSMMGDDGKRIDVGPHSGISADDPAAKAEYVTHDGASLAQCRQSLEDLENRMAALGLAALATSKRAQETAKAKEIDKGATDSMLAATARGVEDGLERALGFHAAYYGLEDGGSVEVNSDFDNMVMDAPTMAAWGTLATALNLPVRVVIEALVDGGRLPEDTDVDGIELEVAANAQAEADRQAAEMEMAMAVKRPPPPAMI